MMKAYVDDTNHRWLPYKLYAGTIVLLKSKSGKLVL